MITFSTFLSSKTPFVLTSKLVEKISFSQYKMMLILKKWDFSLFSASFVINNIQETDQLELVPKSMYLPTRYASSKFEPQVLGSCNGLLCLSFPQLQPLQYPPCRILWNPSTRTHHVIQNEPTSENLTKIDGLGYDEVRHCYKLVRFVHFAGRRDDDEHYTQVWVHSFTNGSWTMVSRVDCWFVPSSGFTDVFLNGSLHFKLLTNIGTYVIVAFDVSRETDKLITKPDCADTISTFELGVLDGCLSMILKKNETYIVLEMKEYGCGNSWVEVFRFFGNGPKWVRPITYVRNEHKKILLLEAGGQLFCFDVESQQEVPVPVTITGMDSKGFTEVTVCTESQRILDSPDDAERMIPV